MKPHIYFDGEKWRYSWPLAYSSMHDYYSLTRFVQDMNEKRAMQYFKN